MAKKFKTVKEYDEDGKPFWLIKQRILFLWDWVGELGENGMIDCQQYWTEQEALDEIEKLKTQ